MPPRPRAPKRRTVDVTVVLVAHNGAAWLPETLAALAASAASPRHVVCVDTGSTDGSAALMKAAFGEVLELPAETGYGAAVAAGLAAVPALPAGPEPTRWIWLLHDDSAPEPATLDVLLDYAAQSPSAALLGPKVHDWHHPRVLVEVGVTTDRAGHRETGLERREYDQGQHDAVRDVLAVGTAGALIRREVWDELGGLDPALPLFRDDLDFGWRVNAAGHRVVVVPGAALRHVRAATTGHRRVDAVAGSPGGADRRHALFVLLTHATGPRLLVTGPLLVSACLLRALVFALTRQVVAARDELAALLIVVGRPDRLLVGWRARRRTRVVPARLTRRLLAPRTARVRARAGAVGDWLSGGESTGSSPLGALGDPGPDGPDELAPLTAAGPGLLRRLLSRPGVLFTLGLALLAVVAERGVLPVGGGALVGGRLLPVPGGARDLWASYAASWHPTSVGSGIDAHPSVAALAALSTLLLGKPWLALDGLLLASVPLAGAVAYVAAGRLSSHRVVRLWAGASWALLPVATGAVAGGRVDAAAVQIALPALLVSGGRLLTEDPRTGGWRRAWGLGLGLGFTAAFAPLLWPLAAAILVTGAVVALATGRPRQALAGLVASAVPFVVLFPWSWQALSHLRWFVDGPGRVVHQDLFAPWQLALLHPGGPAGGLLLAPLGLTLAALGGLLRRERHAVAVAAWGIALFGLAAALISQRQGAWPGTPLQLTAAGLLIAALVGADGVRTRLARRSFGWRQPTAGIVAVAAAVGPLLLATGWLIRGAADPLQRGVHQVLPAFAAAEIASAPGLRALVVLPTRSGVAYELTSARGDRYGDADTPAANRQRRMLDGIVADLLSARGSDAAEALSTRAVRYVAMPHVPGSAPLAAALDVQAGLTRRASGSVLLWRVVAPADRLSLLPASLATAALRTDRGPPRELLRTAPPQAVTGTAQGARTTIAPGGAGRLLVLAAAADRGWLASVDGRSLPRRTGWGWAQAFVVPAQGGRLVLSYDQRPRHLELMAQGAAIALLLVLAAPAARRRRDFEVDEDLGTEPTAPRELVEVGR